MQRELVAEPGAASAEGASPLPLRLGFVGVGWIGRHRMEALVQSGRAEAVALAEPNAARAAEALDLAPDAAVHDDLAPLLDMKDGRLDGVVIATPNALHARQAVQALDAGLAVFCQKPLARNADETRQVVEAARRADRLLGVDLSYRHTAGMQQVRRLVEAGEIGKVYAADLVFHNAYGPDTAWSHDKTLSGGGCLLDLGIHLVDLALWTLHFPALEEVTSRLFVNGQPLRGEEQVEDYAVARLDLAGGAAVRLACSWNLPAGQDAVIAATFYGTDGALAFRNVDGSYYDFTAERFRGRTREVLTTPPDDWGRRAALAWADRLARSPAYDPGIEHAITVAEVLDRIYGA